MLKELEDNFSLLEKRILELKKNHRNLQEKYELLSADHEKLRARFEAEHKRNQELTEEQKKYIYAALVEAREHAMDGGSSKEKHGWFGKYKGRINNYLSKAGYDLNKESTDWHKRVEEREKNKKKE